MSAYTNIHGRKPGRGIRPWLLGPKVLCVCVYFGGLVAAAVVWSLAKPRPGQSLPSPDLLDTLRLLFLCVIVPGLLGAIAFGILLFLQHPKPFLRLRWWQIKMAVVVIMVPTAHLYMSERLAAVRTARVQGVYDEPAMRHFGAALCAMITLSALVVLIGRLKPRFRQNWARAHEKKNSAT